MANQDFYKELHTRINETWQKEVKVSENINWLMEEVMVAALESDATDTIIQIYNKLLIVRDQFEELEQSILELDPTTASSLSN